MKKIKSLKDPIYGYIEIDEETIYTIVDTTCFQRLRNIVQTSYAPLYSAAVHNRFIHSLGVYHLGKIAYEAVLASVPADDKELKKVIKRYGVIFLWSCLLHDVGHAPFSHTGEDYYLNLQENEYKKYSDLHDRLIKCIRDAKFKADVKLEKSL